MTGRWRTGLRRCSRIFRACNSSMPARAPMSPWSFRMASAPADDDVPLTPRELDVLTLLAEGMSNKAIARRLGISVHTAKFHVGALIDKLDAVGRTDAVAHAARRGVIHL